MIRMHRYIANIYAEKFPELEELVSYPGDYARIILKIGNAKDIRRVDLSGIVSPNTLIAVSVAAASCPSISLPTHKLEELTRVATDILKLEEISNIFKKHVEDRMEQLAPNLSHLVGSVSAGQLITLAGGLDKLSAMPACNIQVLGIQRKALAGYSAILSGAHASALTYAPIVQNAPQSLRKSAVRMLAAKCALAARVDFYKGARDGSQGKSMKSHIESRLEKALEPPPLNQRKPLPVPQERPKQHRGGKRIRAAKKKYEMTEVRKYMNRVPFGVEEQEEYRDTGHTFGMLGQTGKLKIKKADHQKIGLSAKRRAQMNKHSGGTASGLTSMYAFTDKAGLELANPDSTFQKRQENSYFDPKSGFATVLANKYKNE